MANQWIYASRYEYKLGICNVDLYKAENHIKSHPWLESNGIYSDSQQSNWDLTNPIIL